MAAVSISPSLGAGADQRYNSGKENVKPQAGIIGIHSKDAHGVYPGFLAQKTFIKFLHPLTKKMAKAAVFKSLNPNSLKDDSFEKLIKDKRLICFTYENGKMKAIGIHKDWIAKIDSEKAEEITVEENSEYIYIKENVTIQPMDDASFNKMKTCYQPAFALLKV